MFPFGVASGDPQQTTLVIWSKLLPSDITAPVEVRWELAVDSIMAQVVASGSITTDAASAFTIHVTPEGLQPGSTYYYRFHANGHTSPTGRTRTAPQDPTELRFAVASCADFQAGHYNAYALIAARNDIDAVIHLGDYIYEGGVRPTAIRTHIPPYEIITLSDYRSRYAQYRLDKDLQEMHRLHPVIAIWDDHEIANNCHRDGAERHKESTCHWDTRKQDALQAYFEWIPVMHPEKRSITRQFSYGGLADLFMLDGRLHRDAPITDFLDPLRFDSARTKLGKEQADWLTTGLARSQARWKVIGNNVMFVPMFFGKVAKDRQWNMDGWDGFPAERSRIFDTLEANNIRNVVVITGDIHTAWAIDLARDPHNKQNYDRKTGRGALGAEFVVHSVSSRNLDEMQGRLVGKIAASYTKARKRNPHLHYANLIDHGYMLLHLDADKAEATWIYSATVKKPTMKTRRGRTYRLPFNGPKLQRR